MSKELTYADNYKDQLLLSEFHGMCASFFIEYVLRQVHSLFQNKVFRECDLLLSLSFSSNFSFNLVHPVAAYVLLLVFPSLLSFHLI